MIDIIDYDMGNLGSIKNMLHRIGCDEVIISRDPSDIEKADKLILPGVGAFDQGIKNLTEFGLVNSTWYQCVKAGSDRPKSLGFSP